MEVGSIEYIAIINTSDYKKGADEIKRENAQLENSTEKTSSKMTGALKTVGKVGFAALATAAVAATAVVVKNIGNAVKRIDTLVAFPRTLQAMGASATEAADATRKLSERLLGLPTPLQDGAAGVQALVAAGLDVQEATDTFLAFNNATLAASVDAGKAQGAFIQLTDSISKGKIEGQEWNSLVSAMPTAFQALSKESGLTRNQLRELYRESPDKLLEDLIRLNKEGGGGLASLEEQAREATGGIATAFANMNTAVTKGLESIVRSLGNNDLEAGQRKISDAISATGKVFGDVLSKLGKGLQTFSNAVSAVLDWLQPLITYIKENQTVMDVLKTTLLILAGIFGSVLLTGIVVVVGVVAALTGAVDVLVKSFTWLMSTSVKVWNSLKSGAKSAWNGVKDAFSTFVSFFSNLWNRVTAIFKNIGTAIGNAISGSVRGAVNSILGFAANTINGFIQAINGAIKLINKIPGVSIGTLSTLNVPRLAEGGIVPATPGGRLAVIGEGGEDEAVIPLSKLDKILNKARSSDESSGPSIVNNIQQVTISSEVDGERWLRRLSGNQEIVGNGLVPTQSYM